MSHVPETPNWVAHAPSNIALIKYMGKLPGGLNIPSNASLSYTLDHLTTTVRMSLHSAQADAWQCLNHESLRPITLSEAAQTRFLSHLSRIKERYHNHDAWLIESANNFPHAAGIASSASSFAALTQCAVKALAEHMNQPVLALREQAALSRQGSGSSCRSLFRPWCIWEGEETYEIQLPYTQLHHQIIMMDEHVKSVSSSEAHRRVCSSPHFKDRPARAQMRLNDLLQSLRALDWQGAYQIVFDEFIDMHRLFETSAQPFSYMTSATQKALSQLQAFWRTHQDGPLVTMDAGANIHLLYRQDQQDMAKSIKDTLFHDQQLI